MAAHDEKHRCIRLVKRKARNGGPRENTTALLMYWKALTRNTAEFSRQAARVRRSKSARGADTGTGTGSSTYRDSPSRRQGPRARRAPCDTCERAILVQEARRAKRLASGGGSKRLISREGEQSRAHTRTAHASTNRRTSERRR